MMLNCDLDSSVPDWVIEYPCVFGVFERLGIDCSCGGRSLRYACACQGHDPARVLQQLTDAIRQADPETPANNG